MAKIDARANWIGSQIGSQPLYMEIPSPMSWYIGFTLNGKTYELDADGYCQLNKYMVIPLNINGKRDLDNSECFHVIEKAIEYMKTL